MKHQDPFDKRKAEIEDAMIQAAEDAACGTVYPTEAEAAGCCCPMHSHARTKLPPNAEVSSGAKKP
jgi:hypothetical protein